MKVRTESRSRIGSGRCPASAVVRDRATADRKDGARQRFIELPAQPRQQPHAHRLQHR